MTTVVIPALVLARAATKQITIIFYVDLNNSVPRTGLWPGVESPVGWVCNIDLKIKFAQFRVLKKRELVRLKCFYFD